MPNTTTEHYFEYIKIPCKQCVGCRISYSKDWATRCVLEAQNYKHNWFVTLTYDDEHLPLIDEFEDSNKVHYYNTGDWKGTLKPYHMTKFIKDLRRYYEYHKQHTGIRFYGCGEYGELYKRPHMHILLFNCPIDDLKNPEIKDDTIIWESDTISKIWGQGIVKIAEVNYQTCAYTARYIMKKITGQKSEEYYCSRGQVREFVRMSRMPGIGSNYYQKNKDKIYETDTILLKKKTGETLKLKPPKYYDRIYDVEYPEKMEITKNIRKESSNEALKLKMSKTSLTEKEQLKVESRTMKEKIKQLKRKVD